MVQNLHFTCSDQRLVAYTNFLAIVGHWTNSAVKVWAKTGMDTNFGRHWGISYYVPIAPKLVILKLIRLEWPTLELFVPGKT